MQKRTFTVPEVNWKSKEFQEGYNYKMARRDNPYDKEDCYVGNQKAEDWDHGWLARFYGETI